MQNVCHVYLEQKFSTTLLVLIEQLKRIVRVSSCSKDAPKTMAPNPDSATLKQLISQLKAEIGDLIPAHSRFSNDLYLLLWLRNYNFEVKQTEKKIRSIQKWRDETGIDKMLDQETDLLCAQHYSLRKGKSKTGRPVLYVDCGKIDFLKVFSEASIERQERFMYQTFVGLEKEMIEANQRNFDGNLTVDSVSGIFILAEAKSIPLRAILTPKIAAFYIKTASQITTYFPGTIQSYVITNAPTALSFLLKAMAKVMSGPYFSMQSISGSKAIEENVYPQIDPLELEALKTEFLREIQRL